VGSSGGGSGSGPGVGARGRSHFDFCILHFDFNSILDGVRIEVKVQNAKCKSQNGGQNGGDP
jgi:hypothetical protein